MIPQNAPEWVWWIAVLILSLALNVVAAYLKNPVDRWLGLYSERRRIKSKEKQAEIDITVRWMLFDSSIYTHYVGRLVGSLVIISMITFGFLGLSLLSTIGPPATLIERMTIYVLMGGMLVFTLSVLLRIRDITLPMIEYRRQSRKRFEALETGQAQSEPTTSADKLADSK